MKSNTGKKIMKELAVCGIENFIKIGAEIIMRKEDISFEDAEKLVVSTLVEVGLAKYLPKPAKANLEEAQKLVKYYKNPSYKKAKEAVLTEKAASTLQKAGEVVNEITTGITSKRAEAKVEQINKDMQ